MLKPVGDNIFLRLVEEKAAGGIVMPDSLKKHKMIIHAVSDESKYKKGQEIVLAQLPTSKLHRDNVDQYLVKESDIVALVVPDKK